MDSLQFKGSRWVKCDLHLHTPASKCFQDRNVTPQQWVSRAIESGLNCVAVTDHNTGDMIDAIKAAAEGTELTIFPGVEITCDTSKVHLLVLFELDKTSDDINDFLIRCGIDRDMFAEQLAGTTKTIFEVSSIANEQGAIVIPAHIDEFNGLGAISFDNLNAFFELPYINAVQIVHKEFMTPGLQINNNEELKNFINEYYSNPSPQIDFTKLGEWHRPVKIAQSKNIGVVTFSDNPHEPKNSKHGLAGIGTRYTWIKMDEKPTLEGLRQAFLLSAFRVKNDFITQQVPYKTPDLWINSISIKNTELNERETVLKIDFSPQLTTIIGGRGSGKSSILRFVRGVFNRTNDITALAEIIADHNDFYKHQDNRSKKGILNNNSEIEIEFWRNKILHKITASQIVNSTNQKITIEKKQSGEWKLEEASGYIDFFEYEQYSQKQIYEIAQEPNSLRERIDKSIEGMEALKNEKEIIKKAFLEKSAAIRTIEQQISGKGKIQTEIKDLEERIQLYQSSGIAGVLIAKESFTAQQNTISEFSENARSRENLINNLVNSIEIADINYSVFEEVQTVELNPFSKTVVEGYIEIKQDLERLVQKAENLRTVFDSSINSSVWKKGFDQNENNFAEQKIQFESQGIEDISIFEKLTQTRLSKETELERIIEIERNLSLEISARSELQNQFLQKTKLITTNRKSFVLQFLQDDKVKVSINPFRNKTDFVSKLRTIIQRSSSFENDIDALTEICFSGNAEAGVRNVKNIFLEIKNGGQNERISGHFANLIKGLPDAQLDEIELMLPEDQIDIKYKPTGSAEYKPLSTASAGQKTTAILTLILSKGDTPLILDQPEDDLDNRLVYELIVNRLKQAKENRQIIVVTHNANIPVNGDAEYIVSMNSDSQNLAVFCSGTVEQPIVKKEICDVMEGTEQAFDMRSKRYKQTK